MLMGQRADTIKPWTKLGEKKWKIKANHVGRLWPLKVAKFNIVHFLGPPSKIETAI